MVLALSVTDATGAGGGGVIVSVWAPVIPSTAATMVADPAPNALTRPVEVTLASEGWLDDHVTVLSVIGLPAASRTLADACVVWPGVRLWTGSVTTTDATVLGGGSTATAAVPLTPSDVAVTTAVPAVIPVTNPVPETVATLVFELTHDTGRFVIGVPELL